VLVLSLGQGPGTPEQCDAFVLNELEKYQKLVRELHVTAEGDRLTAFYNRANS